MWDNTCRLYMEGMSIEAHRIVWLTVLTTTAIAVDLTKAGKIYWHLTTTKRA